MMKRICLLGVAMMLASLTMLAGDNNVFRHYGLSVGVGTRVTDHLGLRGGVDYMPKITYRTWLDMAFINQKIDEAADQYGVPQNIRDQFGLPEKVKVEGKYDNFTGHALLDIHPIKSSGFRITLGAYFGKGGDSKLITAYNKQEGFLKSVADFNARRGLFALVPDEYGKMAAKLGEYNLMPDDNGNANAYIKVNNIRPYAGIGFGRAVPKSRVGFQFDLGVQFWGKPKVYEKQTGMDLEVTKDDLGSDSNKYYDVIAKFPVFPVLTIRLTYRIF